MHQYLLKHSDWLLGELGAADHLPLIRDKTVPVSSVSLLYTMFFIGRRPFDQVRKTMYRYLELLMNLIVNNKIYNLLFVVLEPDMGF